MTVENIDFKRVYTAAGGWFTDVDDNPAFGIFPTNDPDVSSESFKGRVSYTQNSVDGVYSLMATSYDKDVLLDLTLQGKATDFVIGEPVAAISRLSDRLVMYINEVTPSLVGTSPGIITESYQRFSSMYLPKLPSTITKYEFINVEELGVSNGEKNQTFYLGSVSSDPIILPIKGTPVIFIGALGQSKFVKVDNFIDAKDTDKVFTYSSGTVTFGDGVHGAIPEKDSKVFIRVSVRNGGGTWVYKGIAVAPNLGELQCTGGFIKAVRTKLLYGSTKLAGAAMYETISTHSTMTRVELWVTIYNARFGTTQRYMKDYRIVTSLGTTITLQVGSGRVKNVTGSYFVNPEGGILTPEWGAPIKYINWLGSIPGIVTGTLPNQNYAWISNDEAQENFENNGYFENISFLTTVAGFSSYTPVGWTPYYGILTGPSDQYEVATGTTYFGHPLHNAGNNPTIFHMSPSTRPLYETLLFGFPFADYTLTHSWSPSGITIIQEYFLTEPWPH